MNTVRIIGGKWRRRLLRFPDHTGLRPTPDRVRETLFNWLGQDLTGLCCLDLFAGSGVLGFESASRGASKVIMVDNAPSVIAALKKNARILDSESQLEIVEEDAVKFAASLCFTKRYFDVLFIDPPYKQGGLSKIMPFLPELLQEDGFLYVESEQPLANLKGWVTVRHKRAGQAFYYLMQKEEADASG